MEMFPQRSYSPWSSLFILIGISLVCSFVLQFFAVLVLAILSGNVETFFAIASLTSDVQAKFPHFIYVLLLAGSVGTFLLPAFFLQMIERRHFIYFPFDPRRLLYFCILSSLFLLSINPVLGLVSEWNRSLSLPASMSGIEDWMKEKEEQVSLLIQDLVMTASVGKLVLNLLVFAVVPAISEEFFFRGALQGIANRLLKDEHIAIWVTAVIFSAIHFQFYGFFPRMFLGAIFGYLLIWTGNIWVPILAHFLNNASVTIVAFIFASQGKTYQDMMEVGESYPISVYFSSTIFSIMIGYYFYKNRKKQWKTVG